MKCLSKLIIIMLALSGLACVQVRLVVASDASGMIMPLAVGNVWRFVDKDEKNSTAEITKKISIDGKDWFLYREIDDENIFTVRNGPQGQLEYVKEEQPVVQLVLKYPVSDTETYEAYGSTIRVTPGVRVKVPAGEFVTYRYEFDLEQSPGKIVTWFAPNVGPVKMRYYEELHQLLEYELSSK